MSCLGVNSCGRDGEAEDAEGEDELWHELTDCTANLGEPSRGT